MLAGIPAPEVQRPFEYYIIPAEDMAHHVTEAHRMWLSTPGVKGQAHQDSKVRTVHLPPHKSFSGWDISPYCNRWDLIEAQMRTESSVGEHPLPQVEEP